MAFVAAAVAKTGDMKISTPTSTLGIRGTTGLVEVPGAGAAAANREQCGDQALSGSRRPRRPHRGHRPRRLAARLLSPRAAAALRFSRGAGGRFSPPPRSLYRRNRRCAIRASCARSMRRRASGGRSSPSSAPCGRPIGPAPRGPITQLIRPPTRSASPVCKNRTVFRSKMACRSRTACRHGPAHPNRRSPHCRTVRDSSNGNRRRVRNHSQPRRNRPVPHHNRARSSNPTRPACSGLGCKIGPRLQRAATSLPRAKGKTAERKTALGLRRFDIGAMTTTA